MAKGLQNYPNTDTNDSNYPDRKIRDNTGSGNGTPFDKEVYGDIHQVFAKMLRMSKIVANGDDENEYNGFQYITAMQRIFGHARKLQVISGPIATNVFNTDFAPVIVLPEDLVAGHIISLQNPNSPYTGKVRVANFSTHIIDIYTDVAGGPADINGNAAPFALPAGDGIEFLYDSNANNWVIDSRWKLA